MKIRRLLFFYFCLNSTFVFGGAEDSCRLLARQEALLTEAQKVALYVDGFVMGAEISYDYPNVVVSERLIGGCDERYLAASYLSNKISGEERYFIERPILSSRKLVLSKVVCSALEEPQIWRDGASHEIWNAVSEDVFPDFFECIIRRVKSKKIISSKFFTEAAFVDPSEQLVFALRQEVEMDVNITSDQVSMMLFVLRNGGELPDMDRVTEILRRSVAVKTGDIPNDEIIERALELLSSDRDISLSQARSFEEEIWGFF